MTHHHHIIAYYLRLAQRAHLIGSFEAEYYIGRAFLYTDFA